MAQQTEVPVAEKHKEVRRLLEALTKERDGILAQSAPIRAERDKLVKQMQPMEEQARKLARQYQAIEQPRIGELDSQISALAAAIGGRSMRAAGGR